MSKYLPITVSQSECIRKIANEKKIGRARFQQAIRDGSFGRYLDSLKSDAKDIKLDIKPPEGARIHVVRVNVKLDRPWQDAINAAGPNTPDNYNVRKVGDQYDPTGTGEIEEDLILLNYPKGDGNWDKALAWARGAGLKNTVPREAFAVGEQHPKLHKELGQNLMYVVATTDRAFAGERVGYHVWWVDSVRRAYLRWVGDFGSADAWFAFRK